ncbi:hypothetical protein Tco_0882941 [Tanacetum coccineum]
MASTGDCQCSARDSAVRLSINDIPKSALRARVAQHTDRSLCDLYMRGFSKSICALLGADTEFSCPIYNISMYLITNCYRMRHLNRTQSLGEHQDNEVHLETEMFTMSLSTRADCEERHTTQKSTHSVCNTYSQHSLSSREFKRLTSKPSSTSPLTEVERVGPVAYRLKLPQELSCVHDTFHVSNLKKCLAEPDVQVPLDEIEIDENLRFVEEPIEIVERDVKKLKRRRIPLVKVRWNSRQGAEYTWEHEDQFRMKYPHLFSEPVLSSSAAT